MGARVRSLLTFPCAGETLAATLDAAPGTTGLLIVSGGNELRIGAHRGMAMLAQRIAGALRVPVFRFDRRGVGDSTGTNGGFESSADDIAAAVAAFRSRMPQLDRLVAFGNCDAATALALFHSRAGPDALVLANPWVIEQASDLPPPAAIKARYAERLKDPRAWLRLLRGGVDVGKLARGLATIAAAPPPRPDGLAQRMADALAASPAAVTLLLAAGDNMALAFRQAWDGPAFAPLHGRVRIASCASASHSFAPAADKEWLFQRLAEALEPRRSSSV